MGSGSVPRAAHTAHVGCGAALGRDGLGHSQPTLEAKAAQLMPDQAGAPTLPKGLHADACPGAGCPQGTFRHRLAHAAAEAVARMEGQHRAGRTGPGRLGKEHGGFSPGPRSARGRLSKRASHPARGSLTSSHAAALASTASWADLGSCSWHLCPPAAASLSDASNPAPDSGDLSSDPAQGRGETGTCGCAKPWPEGILALRLLLSLSRASLGRS